MKTKITLIISLVAFIVSGCGFWGVRGNGRVKDQSRTIMEFDKIDAGGAFTLKVKVGPSPSLKITAAVLNGYNNVFLMFRFLLPRRDMPRVRACLLSLLSFRETSSHNSYTFCRTTR